MSDHKDESYLVKNMSLNPWYGQMGDNMNGYAQETLTLPLLMLKSFNSLVHAKE